MRNAPRPVRSILRRTTLLLGLAVLGCASPVDPMEYSWWFLSLEDTAHLEYVLAGRVFRQSDPSPDAESRKTIEIDFRGGLALRAQQVEGGRVAAAWSVSGPDYWVEKAEGYSVHKFHINNPVVERTVPDVCSDCVNVSGMSLLIDKYHLADDIRFAVWDSIGHLPPPFPVFSRWTKFEEDK